MGPRPQRLIELLEELEGRIPKPDPSDFEKTNMRSMAKFPPDQVEEAPPSVDNDVLELFGRIGAVPYNSRTEFFRPPNRSKKLDPLRRKF